MYGPDVVTPLEGRHRNDPLCMQDDPEKLAEWSQQWHLPFNPDKCKTLHLGKDAVNDCSMINGIGL